MNRTKTLPETLQVRVLIASLLLACAGVVHGGSTGSTGGETPPVGRAAPGFELRDTEAGTHALEDCEGKIVVLEWTNHECPAVQGAHRSGAIERTRAAVGEDVVWWMVDSSHFCAQKLPAIRAWRQGQGLDVPYLLDPDGEVGHAYGAASTPQLFVIDREGTLAYAGGIEDRSQPEGERTNWVAAAVAAVRAGKAPDPSISAAPGCSVKYAPRPRPAAVTESVTAEQEWVCPPCGGSCHAAGAPSVYAAGGACPGCGMALVRRAGMRKVAIVLWDGVELLDFAGPGEVFAAARAADGAAFEVYTVSSDGEPITSQGFVDVRPNHSLASAPEPDIVVLPGGGVSKAGQDAALMRWIGERCRTSEHVLSVCTGAFLLARAGLLDGLEATTWHGAVDELAEAAPRTVVHRDRRFVDNGRVITSAGVSAGIDGALHLVGRLLGDEAARSTARYMEYDWRPELHERETRGALLEVGFRADAARIRIAAEDEPGRLLRVDGRLVDADSGEPVAGARIELYHTDANGVYGAGGAEDPRLSGRLTTAADGTFQVRTIVPASYPDTRVTRHVHFRVEADGYAPWVSEFLFDDDPLLTEEGRREAAQRGWPVLELEPDPEAGAEAVRGTLRLTIARRPG